MKLTISPARIRSCLALSKMMSWKDALKLSMLSYASEARTEILLKPWNLPIELRPCSSDLPVLRKVFEEQEYAPPWPLAPATILDAGAYIGLSSLYFHQLFPRAQILALEPDPKNFALLEKNTRCIPQIHAVNAALWSSNKSQLFLVDQEAPWASRVCGIPREEMGAVRCMTLSEAAAMLGGRLDLMKFDIEGGEEMIFQNGNEQSLRGVSAVVIEFHDRFFPGSSRPFREAIRELPHVEVTQGENSWFHFEHC